MTPPKGNEGTSNELSKEYQKLLDKRENIIRALKFHDGKSKELNANSAQTLSLTRLATIESVYEKYTVLSQTLEDHDEFDYAHLTPVDEEVVDIYINTVARLKTFTKDTTIDHQFNSTMARNNFAQEVKLPRISIPTFTGNYQEWTTFYDAFISLIDSNDNLPNISKMHYLRSSLKDTALKLISNIPITEVNYKLAWKLLCDRFHNKRAIVNACLNSFINQPQIKTSSAQCIRNLIDSSREALQCIETLGLIIDDWDAIIVFIIQQKMDTETMREWENHLKGSTEIARKDEAYQFLETRFRILDSTKEISQSSKEHTHKTTINFTSKKEDVCRVCKGPHWILYCDTFERMTTDERHKFVNENKLCSVCFHPHKIEDCHSKFKCKRCNGRHSTKLHKDNASTIHAISINKEVEMISNPSSKLLATAIVKVIDKTGSKRLLRAFIDGGSDGALISEEAAQLLCLKRKREYVPLTGIDNISLGKATHSVQLQVDSTVDDSFQMALNALVVKSVMTRRYYQNENEIKWKHLDGLDYADPHFMNPSSVDLLFGVDIYALILKDGLRKGGINEPIAQNSSLGWLIFGALSTKKSYNVSVSHLSIERELRRFWENEEVTLKPILSNEHQQCVDQCNNSIKRLENGKMEISIPFNMDPNNEHFLGDSRKMAMKRYFNLERKFEKNQLFHDRYIAELLNYLQNGHMSLSKSPANKGYYLPHQAVVREESTTTKQRTVYDASAKSNNGFSLNDRCLNGPTIQPELFDIFIRWRTHKVALVADIEKMYRQISVAPEDRKFQKILWRFSKNEPIETYELNTVTFGVKSAPYMAIFATFYLSDCEKNNYPEAAERIKTDFYVDDCLSGSHSIESARKLQQDLNKLTSSGHLSLRKWASNEEASLEGISAENKALNKAVQLNMNESIKTLGMSWTPSSDKLHFSINHGDLHKGNCITKRQLLSDASKLYDPCGLLSPITIKSKMMMQKVWKSGADWDEKVSDNIQSEWQAYKNELNIIKEIKIDRWLSILPDTHGNKVSLHGFCDSSEHAYAAVIYAVQSLNRTNTSALICAKTRVAPIDPLSIPRLELCGAVLLAQLMDRVAENLHASKENIHLWTDSSAVLGWLQSHASRWKTYVAMRVDKIHKSFDATHWRHVRTHDNPADIASRGAMPSQVKNNNLWFNGPEWLLQPEKCWPRPIPIVSPQIHTEVRTHVNLVTKQTNENELMCQFSSFTRLLRITSLIFRFINQARNKESLKYSRGYITTSELSRARNVWIKHVQSSHFAEEMRDILANGYVNSKSTLKSLNPQSQNGILVVNGRLEQSNLSERQKHPIILPAKSHLTQLIIDHAHNKTLHGTIHLTLARVRQEFWVLNARNMVKMFIHRCIKCYRQKPKPLNQLMAPLPSIKTSQSRAFLHCGLDFAGPIEIKISKKRNAPSEKGYICVFVCMASKAVHLELVGDLSTKEFILAVRRFISRRGLCLHIYCDNGTNFHGAANEMPLLLSQAKSTVAQEIAKTFIEDSITFHFNPPSAPSWGGQWESFVKLTKHHLRRMNTSIKLTFIEMYTLLVQIEACINSRPICAITSDICDLDPLTAGHLLIGSPLNLLPEPSLLSLKENTLDRYQVIQKGVQIFWKRFSVEYLQSLHPRKKWYKPNEDLCIGDLVVIIDENIPPAKWLMGRVVQVHPGADGLIRLVTIKTKDGEKNRPIVKLCKLPIAARENVPNGTK